VWRALPSGAHYSIAPPVKLDTHPVLTPTRRLARVPESNTAYTVYMLLYASLTFYSHVSCLYIFMCKRGSNLAVNIL